MSPTLRSLARGVLIVLAAALVTFTVRAAQPKDAEGGAPQRFGSPDDALAALRNATAAKDKAEFERLFGPEIKDLVNPDPEQAAKECEAFTQHMAEMSNIVREGDDKAVIFIGRENWPFPIPLVRKDGQWVFDTAAGKDEILSRRVGEDELNTIDVCRAYVVAQQEFHGTDWNHDDILEYAQHLRSGDARRDGLYWAAGEEDPASPMGPLVAAAEVEEHRGSAAQGGDDSAARPYNGYLFKVLTRQGEHAPGGAYDYIVNGHMVGGFALVAYPAEWGKTGVMTFVVNQRGKVYQKDLGEKTARLAPAMSEYEPDDSWKPVAE